MAVDLSKLESTVKFGAGSEILTSNAFKKAAKLDFAMSAASNILEALPSLIEASVISDAFIEQKVSDKDAQNKAKAARNAASKACEVVAELVAAATK